jgi:hypothetical protein
VPAIGDGGAVAFHEERDAAIVHAPHGVDLERDLQVVAAEHGVAADEAQTRQASNDAAGVS